MDPNTTPKTEEEQIEEATATPPDTQEEETADDFDYSDFVEDRDQEDSEGEVDQPEGEAAKSEEPPKTEGETKPEETKGPEQQVPPKEEVKAAEEPVKAPETQVPPTDQDLNAQVEAFFQKGVEALEPVYKLTPEMAEKLDTTPSEIFPNLAAHLHMQVLTAATTQLANMLPSMMELVGSQQKANKDAEEAFYGKYPQLKAHSQVVDNYAKVYRQVNPDKKMEEAIDDIAAMAMVGLRLPPPTTQVPVQPQVAAPVMPASAQGTATAAARTPEKSVWDELIDEEV